MRRILVTGANGFVGRHLINELTANNIEVIAVGGHSIKGELNKNVSSYTALDLNDKNEVHKLNFKDVDGVIHLAGLAVVAESFGKPMEYIGVNMGIEVNLFEEAISQGASPNFIIVSSGTLYSPKSELPLTEEAAVVPNSPYAIGKLGQENVAAYYASRGFKCTIARPFNHFGPGQNLGLIVPDLAEQAVAVEKGRKKTIEVGNLSARRDYTDVRDIVRAYRLMLDMESSNDTYNICSGKSISGQQILDAILEEMNLKAEVKVDQTKMRPVDVLDRYGSYEKLKNSVSWDPEIDFKTTIRDVVEDWRLRA